jgi:anti-sigma B factor antagonist/stage II sporulation protein AA (anti-sigma F factor antagonist)
VSTFRASVSAGESGPVITLSGEVDLSTIAELSDLITAQLAGGTIHLTIDASGMSFADSASMRVLMLAAMMLRKRGGGLVLLRPQPALARLLDIMDADQVITVRARPRSSQNPTATAKSQKTFHTERGRVRAPAPASRIPGPPPSSVSSAFCPRP